MKQKIEATMIGDRNNPRRNSEGYMDTTSYLAIRNIENDDERFHKLLRTLKDTCDSAGFEIEGRIVLTDKKTGKTWR